MKAFTRTTAFCSSWKTFHIQHSNLQQQILLLIYSTLAAVLFLSLISDLVETCTIDEGTDIFLYLEKCVPFMKAKFNFEPQASTAKLSVLRICNMLLRRLSRASHVQLAGRIHLFLAQILPSTDRSSVNANGMVNDSHTVEIEDVPEV